MPVLRLLAQLLLVLSVSGALPLPHDSHGTAAPGGRDDRARLAVRLGLRMRPAANGALTASGVSDLGMAARSRPSAQPGECLLTGLSLALMPDGLPGSASSDPLPAAFADGQPLRGPPPATSLR